MATATESSGLVASSLQILWQPVSMLESGAVSQRALGFESNLVSGSSPGKHLRHVHDHFRILAEALEDHVSSSSSLSSSSSSSSSSSTRPIPLDYDLRTSRRLPSLETSLSVCLSEFRSVHARLDRLLSSNPTLLDRRERLRATTPDVVDSYTTVGRELWFCALHAIHHYALARIILQSECGCHLDPEFGVAPSTLVHREWKKEADRAGMAEEAAHRSRARL
ncbi:hypothetical protein ACQY0O_005215 [Thecaphora frezii]